MIDDRTPESSSATPCREERGPVNPELTMNEQARQQPPSYDAERERELIRFESRWTAPNYIRKQHKDRVKEYYSKKQGFDGKFVRCGICGKLGEVIEMDIHHCDHKASNNQLSNIMPVHGYCNDQENAKWKAKQRITYATANISDQSRERGIFAVGQTNTQTPALTALEGLRYSNREGAKHDIMRPRFCRWVRDTKMGPFAVPDLPNRDPTENMKHRYSWDIEDLAKTAPYALSDDPDFPLGNWKTYKGYIDEDILAGVLILFVDEGVKYVRFNFERAQRLREMTGR